MKLEHARLIAEELVKLLAPHCERIQIAGSIRREKPEVKDIEIVAIPKPYEIGLFESGIATVVNRWQKIKGELPCKYTQRLIAPLRHDNVGNIKLDLFFATPKNWGLILAIRTGSADYSHLVLAQGWVRKGYESIDGNLFHKTSKWERSIPEEKDLFALIGIDWAEPKEREVRL
jgi:DNA polymerase/3'-5' exonuclease PolX